MSDAPAQAVPMVAAGRVASSAAEFADFVRARTPALLRTAFLLTGDQHAAEDLVRSALTRTERAWRRPSERDHAEASARRAMYRLHISWWRRRRAIGSLAAEGPEVRRADADDAARVVTRLALFDALGTLTAAQRAVLVLRYFDDLTGTETATVLGISVATVRSRTRKALARLRAVAPELAEDLLRNDLADLAERAELVDLHDRVLAASRLARTPSMIGAALVLALVVCGAVAIALSRPSAHAVLPPVGPTATDLPQRPIATYDPTISGYDAGSLAHATLTLPGWVDSPQCPSGQLTFVEDGIYKNDQAIVQIIRAAPVDVDGNGVIDQVAVLECQPRAGQAPLFGYQVLAFTDVGGPGGARTLGRLVASGESGVVGVFGLEPRPDGTIRVEVGDGIASTAPSAQLQWREYAWDGTRFVLVQGPSTFLADPTTVEMALTGAVSSTIVDGVEVVVLTLSVSNTGRARPFAPLLITMAVPENLRPAHSEDWGACVQSRQNISAGQVMLQCAWSAAIGTISYTFVKDGSLGPAPMAVVSIDQGSPRLVERNLRDNQVGLNIP